MWVYDVYTLGIRQAFDFGTRVPQADSAVAGGARERVVAR